jgi:hypothetical protein
VVYQTRVRSFAVAGQRQCPADIQLHRDMAVYAQTFFMLDDLVIFGFAAFAVQKIIDTRYAAISRALGGVILIGLGGWMLAR